MAISFSWFAALAEPRAATTEDAPLPFDLFNLEQLEAHARALAGRQKVALGAGPDRLLPRLRENEARLREVCEDLGDAQHHDRRITFAGEWLLDNAYVIEEQIATARRHLPRHHSRDLPHLVAAPFLGYPRVYHLAIEVIAHVDGRVDRENISRFVAAYQEIAPLTLGELWAIPIMLRLALLENLRRVATQVQLAMEHRTLARSWATRILLAYEEDPRALLLASADMARSDPPLSNAFVAEFVQRLKERSGLVDIPLTWIDHQLAAVGASLDSRVQSESRQQALDQVTVGASIGSLRFLETMPWQEFVEELSGVERVLRRDPSGVYPTMDFSTRDRYRHVVEDLSRQSGVAEAEIAERAVALAVAAVRAAGPVRAGADERPAHVGYYLLDDGLAALHATLPTLPRWRRLLAVRATFVAGSLYFGTITLLTVVLGVILTVAVMTPWHAAPAAVVGVTVLTLLCASQLAVTATNALATSTAPPKVLPRLDYRLGIPATGRTLVVVPTLVTDRAGIRTLLGSLEVRFLGNRETNLHFGLLTDFADADTETTPGDDALVEELRTGIEALNARHRDDGGEDRFALFHRPRRWNPQEGVWMGYERKRGKLEALNHLLRGQDRLPEAPSPAFSCVVADLSVLQGCIYVITLDTDTQLPRDAAHKLIGTMAHPLNRPRHDPTTGCVVSGYGILQPRVAIYLPATRRSWFVRLYAGEAGTDPYTRAVSDVYQDLFAEGSFIGKGIYAIDAFSRAVDAQFADNRILSHDLIEGCYARSGLVSDVILYEDHPSHYVDDVKRRLRWIRGDWQIVQWILPWAPDRRGVWRKNPLGWLSRWKIADNLRRSLVPSAALAVLLVGLYRMPEATFVTGAVLGVYLLPPLFASGRDGLRRPPDMTLRAHLSFEGRALGRRAAHAAATLLFLPEDAVGATVAAGRASFRMFLSGRRLLEWRSPARRRPDGGWNVADFYRVMPVGPSIALTFAGFLLVRSPAALLGSSPLLLLWLASPAVAAWLSHPLREHIVGPTDDQRADLRRLARKTWRFFETYVGPEDHWLPPDNVQFFPVETVAHRTSPTNIGLSLLANLAAHDFGYISTATLLHRTAGAFATLAVLERHRRHFLNWYDTRTLAPLTPLYVSTVDSGNLSGHLLTLAPGLRALTTAPLVSPNAWRGLADTLDVLLEVAPSLRTALAGLRAGLDESPDSPTDARERARRLQLELDDLAASGVAPDEESRYWVDALVRQCRDVLSGPLGAVVHDGGGPTSTAEAHEQLATELAEQCENFALVDYDFLYDETRRLLAIGFSVTEHRRDPGDYDLLASEARLASFVAIALQQLPQAHWFALGRLLTTFGSDASLVSWSGSMFEYLMPNLVMPTFAGTLLDETCRTVVRRQIEHGERLGIPWGVSESGYNATDAELNYQYRAFGVPGLGFKRGLGDERVVAPYATVLALMVAPGAACANLRRMKSAGFEGRYGFYEAIDYTPHRCGPGVDHVLIRSYMAHHQGMSLLALTSVLLDKPMQRRFRSRPSFRATELLLHERVPKQLALYPHAQEVAQRPATARPPEAELLVFTTSNTPRPEVHLLSNGRYSVMVTNAGGGYSQWNGLAITRWREDPTCDGWGTFVYVRDVDTDETWSAAHQPTRREAERYEAIFPQARAEFRRRDRELEVHRDRRLAGRRRGAAPVHPHEPLHEGPHHRADLVRGDRARARRHRRGPPGVQQPVRTDGDPSGKAGDPVHPSRTRAGCDHPRGMPPVGGARRAARNRRIRHRSSGVPRPFGHARRARGRHDRHRRCGARPHRVDPLPHPDSPGGDGTRPPDHRRGRHPGGGARRRRHLRRQTPRRPGVRAGLDPPAGGARPPGRRRTRRPAVPPPRQLHRVREPAPLRQRVRACPEPARSVQPLGLRDLR